MSRYLSVCGILLAFFSMVQAAGAASPSDFGLTDGDLLGAAGSSDPDIYIVNQWGYKRVFLNPAIFGFYGHLRWENVRTVAAATRDAFPTSVYFRNCEANNPRVYALEATVEDSGAFHWVDVSAEQALAQDPEFFKRVFCVNTAEFNWYPKLGAYRTLSDVPAYRRENLSAPPSPSVNETGIPLTVPDGFRISRFTSAAIGAVRLLAFSPDGILFTSVPSSVGLYGSGSASKNNGTVLALPDSNRDGVADEVRTVLSGLDLPHGLTFHQGYLYVVEEGTVSRYAYMGGGTVGSRQVVVNNLPIGGEHLSRTIAFGPNGKMYVAIGSSCNSCREQDNRFASIMEFNADGSGGRVFAEGSRNAVGLVFHLETGEMWATENSRDFLGDNLPPDEINIVRDGKHYGWPYCYGSNNAVDSAFNDAAFCASAQPATYSIQAHSAPLGLRFIQSTQFPREWQGDLLVAYHGSWNRTEPTGYKVVRLDVEENAIVGEHDFLSGWLRPDRTKLGRPVDVMFDPADGAFFITDDRANTIYRVAKVQ